MNPTRLFSKFVFSAFLLCAGMFVLHAQTKVVKSIRVDGIDREYILHIPASYSGTTSVPLVFMLHGTSGDGEKMYNISGWAELSDKEGFIAVFPSSLRYRIDDGELKSTTKWNTTPDAEWTFQPGETGYDDIKFLRNALDEIFSNYNIDRKRVYLNGFSNGGQMAAKCSIDMSDVLAAVCSNAGSFYLDTIYVPKRNTPYLYQTGNKDYGPGNEGPEIPMLYFDSLISTPDLDIRRGKYYTIARNATRNFMLKSDHEAIVGDTNMVVFTNFLPLDPNDTHEFVYGFVKGLEHNYPNWAPTVHWQWLKKYSLDNQGASQYNLQITDGYGSGIYSVGDTIHIWSKQKDGKVFTHWSGDTDYTSAPQEYHSTVVMPARDVNLAANYLDVKPTMVFTQTIIPGVARDKKTYSYFPEQADSIKGIAWFFHGTNGSAASMISDPDTRQLIHLLMAHGYGVIAITSEESEYNLDFDNDGFHRYTYGVDTNLTDIANVRYIRNHFIQNGAFRSSTPHIAIGWSAGGAFSEFLANALGWKAAINHTSSGSSLLSENELVKVPYLVSINENDMHPDVGQEGNEEAVMNVQNYLNRGACAKLHFYEDAPLFPERFDRSALINESLSKAIFNEIKTNNFLDDKNFLKLTSGQMVTLISSKPSLFPVIVGLSEQQRNDALRQIQVTHAEHALKADINGMTIDFIENACRNIPDAVEDTAIKQGFSAYPNPVLDMLYLNHADPWRLYNGQGMLLRDGEEKTINMDAYPSGHYFIRSGYKTVKVVKF